MPEGLELVQFALRCEQCNKPFEKHSAVPYAVGRASHVPEARPDATTASTRARASSNNTASPTLAPPFAQPRTIADSEQDDVSVNGNVNVASGSSAPVMSTTTTPELPWFEEQQLLRDWDERELTSLVQTIDWEDASTIDFADFLHDQTSSPAVLHSADHQRLNTQQQCCQQASKLASCQEQ
ncbi:hypothetical protein Q7P36_007063 [Cladosporium allicinum]